MKSSLLIALSVAVLGLSCGGTVAPPCCTPTLITRNFGYVGSYASDAGLTTTVQLIVSANGEARMSFARGGHEVVETLRVTPR